MNLQILKTKCETAEKIFIGFLGISLLLLINNAFFSTNTTTITILFYFILSIAFLILTYISYVDFKTMEIDSWISLSVLLTLLLINLSIYIFFGPEISLIINEKYSYIPYDNLVLAIILGIIFFIIVLISKEEALGAEDIRVAIIVGLLIGKSNAIPWFYITVLSALVYGVILGNKKNKFKGLKIPFAPFMILGAIVSLLVDMYI